jgi:hypothetical protein
VPPKPSLFTRLRRDSLLTTLFRSRRVFELEDLLLAAWLLALGALFPQGVDPAAMFGPSGWPSLLGGAVLLSYLVVFVSRGSGDADLDQALIRRMFVLGPFVFILSALAPLTNFVVHLVRSNRARRHGEPSPKPWNGWPGPPLPDGLRRALALPFTLVGESAFRGSIGDEIDLWLGGRTLSELPPFIFFAVATLIASYGFLVVGPRVIAGSELAWGPWLLRFGLYLAAWAAGGGFDTWV